MASDRMTDPAGQPAGGRAGEDSLGAKAKGAADRAAEEAGRQARSALDDARTAADEQARKAKDYAAGSFSESAEAIGRAAEEMPAGSVRHELLREASEGLGQIGRSLENRSIGELARGLSDFGRRNPVAFLGGAALVGLALGRFVRASSPDEVPQGAAGGDMGTYGAPPRYGTQTSSAPLGGSATPSPAAGQPEAAPGSTSPGTTTGTTTGTSGPGRTAPPVTPRTATEI